ncbi:MAG: hypothetical protein ACOWW1_09615 [archaeon]
MMLPKILFHAIVLLTIVVSLINSVDATSEAWSRTYGSDEGDYASSVVEASDGGYAVAGITRDDYGFNINGWLIKTDAYGNMKWNQTYGGDGNCHIECVVQSSDGGYVIAGDKYVFGKSYDCWLVKTDLYGNMEWNQTYGGTSPDHASSVVETVDGGYALTGDTHSFGSGGYDCWLVKTDLYGNTEWNQTYGGTNHEHAYSMIKTSDGGFAMAGTTYDSPFSEQRLFLLIKTDAYGNVEWTQMYGGEGFDIAYSLVETSDGGYALAGGRLLVKTDAYGNVEWTQTIGGLVYSLVEVSDVGFVMAGNQLVKTNMQGNIEWTQTYGRGRINSLIRTSDGGYTLAGWTGSLDVPRKTEFWLIKTDEYGSIPEFPSGTILSILCAITLGAVICKQNLKQNLRKEAV